MCRALGIDDRGCTEKIHYAELLVNHLDKKSRDGGVDSDKRKEKKDPVKVSPTSDKPNISPPQPPGAARGYKANDDDID